MTFCLDASIIKPEKDKEIKNAIILLHGYGGDGNDISMLCLNWKRHLPNTIFICPNGHQKCSINPSGFQWFDLTKDEPEYILEESLKAEVKLNNFIDEIKNEFQLENKKICLSGFSQGCMISLNVGLRQLNKLGGIVGISGRLLMPESLEERKEGSYPPVILIHGDADEVVPISSMHDAEKVLNKIKVNFLTHISKNVGHGIAPDGLAKAQEFIKNIFS